MTKGLIKLEYQKLEVAPDEIEIRLFRALSNLLNINDIYESEKNLQPSLED